ncbi:MAG: DUF4260 domain-containing protein [Anaerolineales bacterium]
MKNLIRLEELFLFLLSLFLFSQYDLSWGWFALLFLTPDLSMIGYLINTRFGAWMYNLIHHRGMGASLYMLGALLSNSTLIFAGILLFAHSSFDRVFGYGLKHKDSFQNTHLGKIGK